MRKILFRGKRKNNGEWVEGFYIHVPCGRCSKDEHLIQTIKENGKIGQLYTVIPETVGQYTGLTDKKNIRIFEGDIIAFSDRITKVFYNENCGSWDCKYIKNIDGTPTKHEERSPSKWKHNSEVIGNIHDNPELLSLS